MKVIRSIFVILVIFLVLGIGYFSATSYSNSLQSSNLPKGLSTGAWAIDENDGRIIFWFFQDGKVISLNGFGRYELKDENTLKVTHSGSKDFFIETSNSDNPDGKLLVTITSDDEESSENRVVIKKVFNETSTGDYKKDLLGKWYLLHFTVSDIQDAPIIEFFGDGTATLTNPSANQTRASDYEIIADQIKMALGPDDTQSSFQIWSFGDPIWLLSENDRSSRPSPLLLIKELEALELFDR